MKKPPKDIARFSHLNEQTRKPDGSRLRVFAHPQHAKHLYEIDQNPDRQETIFEMTKGVLAVTPVSRMNAADETGKTIRVSVSDGVQEMSRGEMISPWELDLLAADSLVLSLLFNDYDHSLYTFLTPDASGRYDARSVNNAGRRSNGRRILFDYGAASSFATTPPMPETLDQAFTVFESRFRAPYTSRALTFAARKIQKIRNRFSGNEGMVRFLRIHMPDWRDLPADDIEMRMEDREEPIVTVLAATYEAFVERTHLAGELLTRKLIAAVLK